MKTIKDFEKDQIITFNGKISGLKYIAQVLRFVKEGGKGNDYFYKAVSINGYDDFSICQPYYWGEECSLATEEEIEIYKLMMK